MDFTIDSFFEPHLAPGETRLDAVMTVAGRGAASARRAAGLCVDVSYSMQHEGKIEAARHAGTRWVAALPEDVDFTVVAFAGHPFVIVPLQPATRANKAAAEKAIREIRLDATGTEMSKGLVALREQLSKARDAVRYAYFITDGKNDGETPDALRAEVERCRGAFSCDVRGLGTDWRPQDVLAISEPLLGSADAVAKPQALDADLRSCLTRALSKSTGGVRLRLWTPGSIRIASVHQMSPEDIDVTSHGVRVDARSIEFPVGAWGNEARDYHVVFEASALDVGEEVLMCRPSVHWVEADAERKAAGAPVVATWSGDEAKTSRINPEVAHYTGQAELASSIRDGLLARDHGDEEAATRLLGRAVSIAAESGNEDVTRRLSKVVDVVDADRGTVRLRRGVGRGEELELEMGGTRTVRRGRSTA